MIIEDLNIENQVTPSKKLEDLIHLAELCVDLLQQNEEHYAEVCDLSLGNGAKVVFGIWTLTNVAPNFSSGFG